MVGNLVIFCVIHGTRQFTSPDNKCRTMDAILRHVSDTHTHTHTHTHARTLSTLNYPPIYDFVSLQVFQMKFCSFLSFHPQLNHVKTVSSLLKGTEYIVGRYVILYILLLFLSFSPHKYSNQDFFPVFCVFEVHFHVAKLAALLLFKRATAPHTLVTHICFVV